MDWLWFSNVEAHIEANGHDTNYNARPFPEAQIAYTETWTGAPEPYARPEVYKPLARTYLLNLAVRETQLNLNHEW